MSVYNPEELDYDEELFERLSSISKSVLVRFYNLYCDEINNRPIENSAHSKKELRQIIAAEQIERINEFLEDYERLKDESVRTSPAVEHVSSNFELNPKKLDIDTRYELLILLYEEGLNEILNELIVLAKMRTYSSSRDYVLPEELDISEIEDGLQDFHEKWNSSSEDNKPARVKKEFQSENLVVLKILQEVNPQSPQTFRFRENNLEEVPIVPELTTVSYHKLKTVRVQIASRDGDTELVFSKPFTRWRNLLPELFEVLFDIDDLFEEVNRVKSEVADNIEENMIQAIDEGGDPVETARDTISSRKEEAENEVDKLDLPANRKEKIKQRINTITISGSEITGDQSIETQEFRLIAGLEGLFDSVDIEQGFKDMIEKADSDKQSFVLTVDERPVELNNGKWSKLGVGQLRDLDRRALEIFFDSEVEL